MYIRVRKMTASRARAVLTVAVAAVLSGCAMKGDIRELQTELRTLIARQDSLVTQIQAELRAEASSTQDTLRTQSNQLFDFRGDISRQLQQMAQSLRTLEALAGENQRGIAAVRDQLASGRSGAVTPPPMFMPDSAAGGRGGSEQILGGGAGNPGQLFEVARDQYDRGSLNAATMAFQQFLEEFPAHERAAEAHYFLADILAQQDRPEDAIEAFQEIQTLFPAAEIVPQAMFRIAKIQVDVGDTEDAKATLQRIINTYPGEIIAMLARDELERIG